MPKGLLTVSGTIDLAQFWPLGESDADTVKVLLSGPDAFQFSAYPEAPPKVTHAFSGATVRGKVSKPAIDKQNRITIRLQGIDAPELHYRPLAPTLDKKKPTPEQRTRFNDANGNFRQNFGETASTELQKFLSRVGPSPIECLVHTAVDEPNDVFDTFGRLVGDIVVTMSGSEQNANHWLCENGWAFPTFYSSMTKQEIDALTTLSEKARTHKSGIWKKASSNLKNFDRGLLFRNHGTPNPAKDVGPVIVPKLFRRQSTFEIAIVAKMTKGLFKTYLEKEPDECFETKDFLSQGPSAAIRRHLDEFVTTAGTFAVGPKDLIFQESQSHVVDQHGKQVQW